MNMPNLKEAKKRTNNKVETIFYNENEKYKNIVKNKKYFLKTYGCQMNEHDSENIKAIIEYMGYENTDKMEEADLIVLNTCSIRENANNKVFGMLGRAKHLKQTKKDLIVGIMGCMTQEEIVTSKIENDYKWINFVLGTHKMELLSETIYKSLQNKTLEINAPSIEGNILENIPTIRNSKIKAFVNIMYGCDKFCTYCIVPYTRGKQRSRNPKDIINEIEILVKNNYKEVTLLGQNVNAYGKDLEIEYNMANLLEDVAKTGIPRIRFVTSHPWDFNDDMIEVIAKYPNIMHSIHLPVQSGNSEILKLMGRRYTKEEYLNLFNKLKKKMPDISITTDIIVGFPNETKEQFEDTLDLVNKCKYDLAYTFIYSKREGTPAAKMKDSISLEEKEERLQKLNNLINKYALENNLKMVGKTYKVLIEGPSDKNNSLMGYTENNKLVNIKGPNKIIGSIVDIKITSAKTWSLDGEYNE